MIKIKNINKFFFKTRNKIEVSKKMEFLKLK